MQTDYQITFLEAEAGPCPVCGEPNGNCRGESTYSGSVTFEPPTRENPGATFTVANRVYEEVKEHGRVVKRLLYPIGARITPDEAKRLELMPK